VLTARVVLEGRPLPTKRGRKREEQEGREEGGREGASERASERVKDAVTGKPKDTRTRGWNGWKKWVARGCQELG